MSGFKGTPGPWKAQLARSGSNRLQVSNPSGRQVCALWRHGPAETEANRNLITAAPELLEVCQKFSALFGALWDTVDPEGGGFLSPESVEKYDAVHAEMSAAIAKATGGAA